MAKCIKGYTCNGNPIRYDKHDVHMFWIGAACVIAPLVLILVMVINNT